MDVLEGSDRTRPFSSQLREYHDAIVGIRDRTSIANLSMQQMVALAGPPRSQSKMMCVGFSGSYIPNPNTVFNTLFKIILTNTWEEVRVSLEFCK